MVSEIYSLADYKLRPEERILKNYLNGKYGALPHMDWKLHLSTYWKERRIILNRPKNNKIRRPQFLCIVGCEGKTRKEYILIK